MEQKFIAAWLIAREQAMAMGVRLRPMAAEDAMKTAQRVLCGRRESDGFFQLSAMGALQLSLEALAVDKRFTALFTDEQANTALDRLMAAGYYGI